MSKPKVKESGPDIADAFLQLIQALLKDPEARQNFFAVKLLRIPLGQTIVSCFGICRNHTVFELDFLFVRPCRLQKVLPVEFGTRYDNDLQTLFAEFVFRLNQLLPVPDMDQVSSCHFVLISPTTQNDI